MAHRIEDLREALTKYQVLVGTNVRYGAGRHRAAKRQMAALEQRAEMTGSLRESVSDIERLAATIGKMGVLLQVDWNDVAHEPGGASYAPAEVLRKRPRWRPPWIIQVWIDALRGCWLSIQESRYPFVGRAK
jgi:hypothetical protein